jgi:RNA polymerase sigma factor (sigma-70 family)
MRPEPPPNFADLSDDKLAPLFQQGVPGVLEILHARHEATFCRQVECLIGWGASVSASNLLREHSIQLRTQRAEYDTARAADSNNPWQPWASAVLFRLGFASMTDVQFAKLYQQGVFATMSAPQLATFYQQGVYGALGALYELHQVRFRNLACRIKSRYATLDAEDLLQEFFVHLSRERVHKSYNPSCSWRPWASSVLYSLAPDIQRRKSVRIDASSTTADAGQVWQQRETTGHDSLDHIVSHEADPSEKASATELQEDANHCLDQLPSDQRQVMALHLAGYSNPQIASELNTTVGLVGQLLFHARNNMAACLPQGWEVNR